jgi:hypothetical protein
VFRRELGAAKRTRLDLPLYNFIVIDNGGKESYCAITKITRIAKSGIWIATST